MAKRTKRKPSRRPIIAGNWKMHKTDRETKAFLKKLVPKVEKRSPQVVICPPFTSLRTAVEATAKTPIKVAAQNMHEAESGAFTGEVSAPMLANLKVHGVILGHSERRQLFGETDEALALKVPAALAAGLQPILCVGETESERDAGETADVLTRQIDTDLSAVPEDRLAEVVIAYEPIWAIGTGKTATPGQAQEAIELIRVRLSGRSTEMAERVRILYGGSVKPDNAAELMCQSDVDGALVGGASLEPADFLKIVEACSS